MSPCFQNSFQNAFTRRRKKGNRKGNRKPMRKAWKAPISADFPPFQIVYVSMVSNTSERSPQLGQQNRKIGKTTDRVAAAT
jgi:hypothetical protein